MAKDRTTSSKEHIASNGDVDTTNQHAVTERDSDSVTVTRGQKGTYGWEIKVYGQIGGAGPAIALEESIERMDETLRQTYKNHLSS